MITISVSVIYSSRHGTSICCQDAEYPACGSHQGMKMSFTSDDVLETCVACDLCQCGSRTFPLSQTCVACDLCQCGSRTFPQPCSRTFPLFQTLIVYSVQTIEVQCQRTEDMTSRRSDNQCALTTFQGQELWIQANKLQEGLCGPSYNGQIELS